MWAPAPRHLTHAALFILHLEHQTQQLPTVCWRSPSDDVVRLIDLLVRNADSDTAIGQSPELQAALTQIPVRFEVHIAHSRQHDLTPGLGIR
jgi:hypothetical protein